MSYSNEERGVVMAANKVLESNTGGVTGTGIDVRLFKRGDRLFKLERFPSHRIFMDCSIVFRLLSDSEVREFSDLYPFESVFTDGESINFERGDVVLIGNLLCYRSSATGVLNGLKRMIESIEQQERRVSLD